MSIQIIRTGYSTKKIGQQGSVQIVLDIAFNDSAAISNSDKPVVFSGFAKPIDSKAVTFQAVTFNTIIGNQNGIFTGQEKSSSLRHIYAEQVLVGDDVEKIINQAGAKFMLEHRYPNGTDTFAQVSEGLFMPVRSFDVVLDKNTGATVFAQGACVLDAAHS